MLFFFKRHRHAICYVLLSVILYWIFAYQLLRVEFVKMLVLWVALFFSFVKITQYHDFDWKILAIFALVFRCIFLFSIPNLSQDFYRFIWDGSMLLEGFNPYLSTPEEWILQKGFSPINNGKALYEGMGKLNASHYTNYPPISQLCYGIAAFISKGSILGSAMVFRVLIILADIGSLIFGRKLLKALKLPEKKIFWYILNPFLIIEMTGNLHFESVMIFFLIWSLYEIQKQRWFLGAILLGISVSVKLIPLIFAPILIQCFRGQNSKGFLSHVLRINYLKAITFYCILLLTVFVTFLPFLSTSFVVNFTKTLGLWFQNFEFNASIYYIIRWIGFQLVGWNIIQTVGKILPLITISIVIILAFFKNNKNTSHIISSMVLVISVYYFLSTTVHPWYIAVPLSLCVFTSYKFPFVWSFVIISSYSAYQNEGFQESLLLIAIAYVIIYVVLIFELFKPKINAKLFF